MRTRFILAILAVLRHIRAMSCIGPLATQPLFHFRDPEVHLQVRPSMPLREVSIDLRAENEGRELLATGDANPSVAK